MDSRPNTNTNTSTNPSPNRDRRTKISKIFYTILAAILIAAGLSLAPEIAFMPGQLAITPKPPEYAKVLFVGDLMFDRGIRLYASQAETGNDFIFSALSGFLAKQDLVVANLEGPITSNKSVSLGTKPGSTNNYYFTFDPSVAQTLYKQNIRLVSLGNNHILNFGMAGLAETKKYLDQARVGYFGLPDYPRSASQEIKGVKITIINYNEFSKLGGLEAGAAIEEIKKARDFSDIIIVYCHWGAEYVGPDQAMKDLARQFIDSGADAVIGSHPHVIGPSEEYNGKKIYYSLGNFIFDQYFDSEVRRGLGVILNINAKTKEMSFEEQLFEMKVGGQTVLSK